MAFFAYRFESALWLLLATVPFLFAILLLYRRTFIEVKPWGGPANAVTLLRWGLLFYLVYQSESMGYFLWVGLILGSILMDAIDGSIARKTNSSSELGGVLDVEADAYFMLVYCFDLYLRGIAGEWILLPGIIKYGYDIIVGLWGRTRLEIPKIGHERYTALAAFILLFVPPVVSLLHLPNLLTTVSLVGATVLILFSFSISFYFVFRPSDTKK